MQVVQIVLSVDETLDDARVRIGLLVNGEMLAERDAGPPAWTAVTRAMIARMGPEAEAAILKVEKSIVDTVKARNAKETKAQAQRREALVAWGVTP